MQYTEVSMFERRTFHFLVQMGDKLREKNLNKYVEKQQVQVFAYRTQRVTKWFENPKNDDYPSIRLPEEHISSCEGLLNNFTLIFSP